MNDSPICYKNFKESFYPIASLLILSLLSGCASESQTIVSSKTSSPIQTTREHFVPHKNHSKHAYNRPYRVNGRTYYPLASASGYSETGLASWYGSESGSKTSMGTHFSPNGLSAAHKTLPLPSKVRVTNLRNGRSVVLMVTDRGPFKNGRIIDLSHGAARRIGLQGVAMVKVDYLGNIE